MPGMDGWEFLESYHEKTRAQGAKTRIVLLTNSSNPLDRERAGSYKEVVAFKTKPLTDAMVTEIMGEYFPAA
jgi:CheY-like chemotaxis protein